MKSPSTACIVTVWTLLLIAAGCHTAQEGAVEGRVIPPDSKARVTIDRSGTTVRSIAVNDRDGRFRAALAPGTYDVTINSSSTPFPVTFPGITITAGRTATLPPIELPPASGTAEISGTVFPIAAGGSVALLHEGRERATVDIGKDGRYEFTGLPPGTYTVRAASPGYAADTMTVRVRDDEKTSQNMRLLYISDIEGIDWAAGVIRAAGRGRFPARAANRTVMREMARRAAISDAERNFVRIIGKIRLDPGHELGAAPDRYSVRVRGFLRGFSVVDEREIDGGIELTLEVPLSGPSGLARVLAE